MKNVTLEKKGDDYWIVSVEGSLVMKENQIISRGAVRSLEKYTNFSIDYKGEEKWTH